MEKKGELSKKQLKKLKQQQKRQLKNQQQLNSVISQEKTKQSYQPKQTISNQSKPKPNFTNKSQRKSPKLAQSQQKSSQNSQESKQLPLQEDGDIDLNQLQADQHSNIDVTFLIAQIREEYYHSMKTVLLRYSQVVGLTESELASEILEKGNSGNVIVAEDDQDEEQKQDQNQSEQEDELQKPQENDELNVYSVVTLLPSNAKVTEKIKKQATHSLEKNKSTLQKNYNKLRQILTTPKSCSLLLSARLPNLPSFIVCDSHEVFASDLQELRKKNSKQAIFQSEYVLNISEVEITANQTLNLDELIFSKYQDYEFCQKSVAWWVGENIKSQRQKADLRRLYFVIRLKDYLDSVKNIRSYLDEQ